jgi:hypothetical protein
MHLGDQTPAKYLHKEQWWLMCGAQLPRCFMGLEKSECTENTAGKQGIWMGLAKCCIFDTYAFPTMTLSDMVWQCTWRESFQFLQPHSAEPGHPDNTTEIVYFSAWEKRLGKCILLQSKLVCAAPKKRSSLRQWGFYSHQKLWYPFNLIFW